MSAIDYLDPEIKDFVRGYSTIDDELKRIPAKLLKIKLFSSYKSVSSAEYLGNIEKNNMLWCITQAIDELYSEISEGHPEICI